MGRNNLIQIRQGTASAWSGTNPILSSGEPGFDNTNNILKIGDGSKNWNNLTGVSLNTSGTTNFIPVFQSDGSFGDSIINESGNTIGINTPANGVNFTIHAKNIHTDHGSAIINENAFGNSNGAIFFENRESGTRLGSMYSYGTAYSGGSIVSIGSGGTVFSAITGPVAIGPLDPYKDLIFGAGTAQYAKMTSTEFRINHDGLNRDFRVEGDSDQDLIVADASTDRVGIGTGVPEVKLHVSAATGEGTIISQTYANNSWAGLLVRNEYNQNVASFQYGNSGVTHVPSLKNVLLIGSRQSGVPVKFYQGAESTGAFKENNERIIFDVDGNTILTAASGQFVNVSGNIVRLIDGYSKLEQRSTDPTTAAYHYFYSNDLLQGGLLAYGSGYSAGSIMDMPSGSLHLFSNYEALAISTFGVDKPIVFGTYASSSTGERMRIAGDGKVGIGHTSPNSKLHVMDNSITGSVHDMIASGTMSSTPMQVYAENESNTNESPGGFSFSSTKANGVTCGAALTASSPSDGYGWSPDIILSARSNIPYGGATWAKRLVVTSRGRVSIPDARNGDGGDEGEYKFAVRDSVSGVVSGLFAVKAGDGGFGTYITASGTGVAFLDVDGSGSFRCPARGLGLQVVDSGGTGLLFGEIAYGAYGGGYSGDLYTGMSHTDLDGDQEYIILSKGDHTFVSAKSGYASIIRGGDNNQTYQLLVNNFMFSVGQYSEKMKFDSSKVEFNVSGQNLDFQVNGTSDNILYVDASTDSVGIGTDTPHNNKLRIHHDIARYNSENTAHIKLQDSSGTIGGLLGADATGQLFYIQAVEPGSGWGKNIALQAMGGKVGVSTIDPTDTLSVSGTTRVQSLNINGAFTFPTGDGSDGQAMVTDGSGNLSFANVSGAGGGTDTFVTGASFSDLDGAEVTLSLNSGSDITVNMNTIPVVETGSDGSVYHPGTGLGHISRASYFPVIYQSGGYGNVNSYPPVLRQSDIYQRTNGSQDLISINPLEKDIDFELGGNGQGLFATEAHSNSVVIGVGSSTSAAGMKSSYGYDISLLSTTYIFSGHLTQLSVGGGATGVPRYTFPGSDGSSGQALITDGAGNLSFSNVSGAAGGGSGISDIVEDTTPQLGGNLDLNGKTIESGNFVFNSSNGNYDFIVSGTGSHPLIYVDPDSGTGRIGIGRKPDNYVLDVSGSTRVSPLSGATHFLTVHDNTDSQVFVVRDSGVFTRSPLGVNIPADINTNYGIEVYDTGAMSTGTFFFAAGNGIDGVGAYVSNINPSGDSFYALGVNGSAVNWVMMNDASGRGTEDTFVLMKGNIGSNDVKLAVTASGDVGIGTDSPQAKLDVNGTVQFDNLVRWEYPDKALDTGIDVLGYLRFYDEANGIAGIGVSTSSFNIGTTGDINIRFIGQQVELARFDTVGNFIFNDGMRACDFRIAGDTDANLIVSDASADKVGIGNNSPTSKLDVSGTITSSGGNSTQWNTAYGWGDHSISGYIDGSGTANFIPLFSDFNTITGSVIQQSGVNIGIGAVPTSRRLTVRGKSSDNSAAILIQPSGLGTTTYDGLLLSQNNAGLGYLWNFENKGLVFATNNLERMRIDESGNVGIGTSSPAYKLDVTGETRIMPRSSPSGHTLYLGRHAYQASIKAEGSTEPNQWMIIDSAGSGMRTALNYFTDDDVLLAYGGGNVGVGTTSPGSHKFRVAGGSSVFDGGNVIINDNGDNYDFRVEGDSDEYLFFTDASADRVGIGTDSPSNKLEVVATGVHEGITVRGTNAPGLTLHDNGGLGVSYPSGGSKIVEQSSSLHTGVLILDADTNNVGKGSYISLRVDNTERVQITEHGNVGIGVDPDLFINDMPSHHPSLVLGDGDGHTSQTIYSATGSAGVIYFADGTGDAQHGAGYIQYTHSEDHMQFAVNQLVRMRIDSAGNVGIGTSSPTGTLTIHPAETGNHTLEIARNANKASIKAVGGGSTTSNQWLVMDSAGRGSGDYASINHFVNDDVLLAYGGGNVGIGAAPTQKLDVRNGDILVGTKLLVGSGVYSASSPGAYFGLKHTDLTGSSEYMIMSAGTHTYLSAKEDSHVYIRGGGNKFDHQIVVTETGVTIGKYRPAASSVEAEHDVELVYDDSGCVRIADRGGSGVMIGDCALSGNATYAGIKHTAMSGSTDYMMVSDGSDTYISAKDGESVFIRGGGNAAEAEIRIHDVGAGGVGIVFNEAGSDRDIRMEGASDANLFRLDASTDRIGIGTATPAYKLDVNGQGRFVHSDGACGLFVEDEGGSGIHIGDCAYDAGSTYAGMKHSSYTGSSEYMIISQGDHTFLSAKEDYAVIIRGGNNNSKCEIRVYDADVDGQNGVVINEGGWDRDTRIEGTGDQNLFKVDASADSIGIGTNTPAYKLDVVGTFSADSINVNNAYTFPTGDGTAGHSLVTDGAGNIIFSGVTGGGGGISNVVEDTSPQLGGNLQLESKDIIGTGNMNIVGTITGTSVTLGAAGTQHLSIIRDAGGTFGNTVVTDLLGDITFAAQNTKIKMTNPAAGAQSVITMNPEGVNQDFIVEGNTDEHLLFADASTDKIGIGNSSPAHKLDVSGTINASTELRASGHPAIVSNTGVATGSVRITNIIMISSGTYASLSSIDSSTLYILTSG